MSFETPDDEPTYSPGLIASINEGIRQAGNGDVTRYEPGHFSALTRKLETQRVDEITKMLYEMDPLSLARIGAPEDEYSPEAEMYAWLTRGERTLTIDAVNRVWIHWFDQDLGDHATEVTAALAQFRG